MKTWQKQFDEKFNFWQHTTEQRKAVKQFIQEILTELVNEMIGEKKERTKLDEECEWCHRQFCGDGFGKICLQRFDYNEKRQEMIDIAKKYKLI